MNQVTNYVYWLRGSEFAELAELSIESIHRIDSNAKVHIWTDSAQTTPRIKGTIYHDMQAKPTRPAMIANLDAQIGALNYLMRGDRILFLDADTLMLKPFPWALHPQMFVTYRKEVNGQRDMAILQPYNYGVMGVNVCPEVIEAFHWLRARIFQMNSRNQAWYGNQLALAELVGSPPQEGTEDKSVRVSWGFNDTGTALVVRQLPCTEWNYSPDGEGEDISGRGILHLKGNRKDLMKHYAEAA